MTKSVRYALAILKGTLGIVVFCLIMSNSSKFPLYRYVEVSRASHRKDGHAILAVEGSNNRRANALASRTVCIERIRQRHRQDFGNYFHNLSESHHILLVDPAYHQNFGDTLLTRAEKVFFDQMGKYVIDECTYNQGNSHGSLPNCRNWSPTSEGPHLAFWQAGGNWGDLYRYIQNPRLESFVTLLRENYTIAGFPQSLYYRNSKIMIHEAKILKDNIAKGLSLIMDGKNWNEHQEASNTSLPQSNASEPSQQHPMDTDIGRALARSRVTLTWRELSSYEKALEIYPFVTNMLVPDMAFEEGPFPTPTQRPTVDILFFLRKDDESKYPKYQKDEDNILTNLLQQHNPNLTHTIVDWESRYSLFGNDDRFNISTAVDMLQMSRVMICDRLHAAILGYLSQVPFVYLDQVSNKVTNVLNVSFSSTPEFPDDNHDCMDGTKHMFKKASSIEEAIPMALQMIEDYDL